MCNSFDCYYWLIGVYPDTTISSNKFLKKWDDEARYEGIYGGMIWRSSKNCKGNLKWYSQGFVRWHVPFPLRMCTVMSLHKFPLWEKGSLCQHADVSPHKDMVIHSESYMQPEVKKGTCGISCKPKAALADILNSETPKRVIHLHSIVRNLTVSNLPQGRQ